MNAVQEMNRRIYTSPHYSSFLRSTLPLKEQLGINHFWYYKITNAGTYTYIGTNPAWIEFCLDSSMLKYFSCLKHPDVIKKGMSLMKADDDKNNAYVLEQAWDKFKVNFNVNIVEPVKEGIEAFGFASSSNDVHADERIINNLPLLRGFMTFIKNEQQPFFQVLEENKIDLIPIIGTNFYKKPSVLPVPFNKDNFLNNLGFYEFLSLSQREKQVLKYLTCGFPSSYVANEMHISKRTVEHHIENIKSKLFCESKIALICKARELATFGYFDH